MAPLPNAATGTDEPFPKNPWSGCARTSINNPSSVPHQQRAADTTPDTTDGIATIVDGAPTISFDGALFAMLNGLGTPQWLTIGLAVLAMVLTAIFFVTGAAREFPPTP